MPFYFRKECPLNSGYLNGDKNGDANQVERDVSAVTEGWPAEMHSVRKSDAVYGAEAGLPSGRAGYDAWAAGPNAVLRLRAAEGKLRPFWGKWSKKTSPIPCINQCQQYKRWYIPDEVPDVLNKCSFFVFLIFPGDKFLSMNISKSGNYTNLCTGALGTLYALTQRAK